MSGWEFDFDLLDKSVIRWVPWSVRYGYRKVSDFARKTPEWPVARGTLWERVAS